MYYRNDPDSPGIQLKVSGESAANSVQLSDFDFISGAAFHPAQDALLITAVRKGDRLPGFKPPYRGDLRLYRYRLDEQQWQLVYQKYANDPTPIANSTDTAIHTGGGLAILDVDGKAKAVQRVSNFNWGPPALSSSPGGTKIGMVRWKGDHSHVFAYDIARSSGVQYKPSCYGYDWYDDTRIVYGAGSGIRMLDLNSGKFNQLLGKCFDPKSPFRASIKNDPFWDNFLRDLKKIEDYSYGRFRAIQNRLFFILRIVGTRQYGFDSKMCGVFSIGGEGDEMRAEHTWEPEPGKNVTDFEVDADGTIVLEISEYENSRLVNVKWSAVGGSASPLANGWGIMPTGNRPEFGFHYIGQFDKSTQNQSRRS